MQLEAKLKKYYKDVITAQSVVRAFFARKMFRRLQARARMDAAQRAADAAKAAEERRSLCVAFLFDLFFFDSPMPSLQCKNYVFAVYSL